MYARRVIMQSLKSIRLAEVDSFFKQSFEQKKTDSTVAWLWSFAFFEMWAYCIHFTDPIK